MENQTTSHEAPKSNALASKPSQEQLQQLLVGLMGEGLIRFKYSQPTEVEQKLYLVDWLEMVREHGLERFTKAVGLAYRKGSFFPQPSDIEKWIEPADGNASTYQPPTAEQVAFRGTEEQRDEWRKIKAKIDEIGKMPNRMKDTRNYTPTLSELAKDLAANPLVRVGRKETA